MPRKSQTQARSIWMELHADWPNWTPAPRLARISLQYCARIRELREAGILIANRVEYRDGKKHGFYRLGSAPIQSSKELREAKCKSPASAEQVHPESLFGDLSPERSYLE
jgi:hypothetical protein